MGQAISHMLLCFIAPPSHLHNASMLPTCIMQVIKTAFNRLLENEENMEIQGKTVLVTGANRGIGAELVRAFLNAGVGKVYAGARNTSQLPAFNDTRVVALKLDITKPADVNAAVKTAGDVDVLVNNAGVAKAGDV